MAALARHTTEATKIAGAVDFFVNIMDEESYRYLTDRLLSRVNPISLEEITAVVQWIIEEWSARPTLLRSDSSPSPSSDGPRSTPVLSESTSSDYLPIGS